MGKQLVCIYLYLSKQSIYKQSKTKNQKTTKGLHMILNHLQYHYITMNSFNSQTKFSIVILGWVKSFAIFSSYMNKVRH